MIELEAAVFERNLLLAERLRPGLSEKQIVTMLNRANIKGAIEPIIGLYSWRNGTVFDQQLMSSKSGFFPHEVYQFIELKRAIADMNAYADCMCKCFPKIADLVGRYFPVFWNGATNWMALDLKPSNNNRVVIMRYFTEEPSLQGYKHEENPPREAYKSFQEFISDVILANKNNVPLRCFQLSAAPPIHPKPSCKESAQNTGADKNKIPPTKNALALRTDFLDESAWKVLCATIEDPNNEFGASVDFVSDPKYDGLTAEQVPSLISKDSSLSFAFIIDRMTFSHPDHPILVIDLHDTPGRTFRVIASKIGIVENNLSIANMSFDEFADAVDHEGIFRGFREK